MKILVTGAAGFLGRRLLTELLAGRTAVPAVSRVIAADLAPCPIDDPRVESRVGDITDAGFISAIVDRDVRVIWHLAAVLSGQSEAEFDVGLRVNVDATRALLDRARTLDIAMMVWVLRGPGGRVVPTGRVRCAGEVSDRRDDEIAASPSRNPAPNATPRNVLVWPR